VQRVLSFAQAVAAMPKDRLASRLVHEAKRLAIGATSQSFRTSLATSGTLPSLRPRYLTALAEAELQVEGATQAFPHGIVGPDQAAPQAKGPFEILGLRYARDAPIDWSPRDEGRLWGFTLHYFDWAVAA